jgi:hypothetical protein
MDRAAAIPRAARREASQQEMIQKYLRIARDELALEETKLLRAPVD